jgi:hypothetical protein
MSRCNIILGIVFVIGCSVEQIRANQPVAEMPARTDGLATVFTASGKLEAFSRQVGGIAFFSNKPFWGPPHYGREKIVLWPADTLFVLSVAGPTPITVDGKKAKFTDLVAGQNVSVQYQLTVGAWGPMICTAVRIDVRNTPARDQSRPHKPTKG